MSRTITHAPAPASNNAAIPGHTAPVSMESRLSQWPVQIKLVPVRAPYFDGAKLLVAADCTAYAYGNFHNDFIDGHVTLIGCPKLDSVDYSEKLTEIIRNNDIQSVTVVRMEVPCCGDRGGCEERADGKREVYSVAGIYNRYLWTDLEIRSRPCQFFWKIPSA